VLSLGRSHGRPESQPELVRDGARIEGPGRERRSEPEAMSPKARQLLWLLAKVAVAAVLIAWLLRSRSLDFGALRALVTSPVVLAANLGAWLVCSVVLSTARWRLLLRLAGVKLPWWRGTQLQMMALFFNVVVPGNVGGDVLKSLYVARDAPSERRPAILLVVLIERLLGVAGLVAMGAAVTALRWPLLWGSAQTRPLVLLVGALAACFLAGPLVAVALLRRLGEPIARRLGTGSKLAKLSRQLLEAADLAARRPAILVIGFILSMAMHATAMAYFTLLTRVLGSGPADYATIATVFPLGLLTIVLPISPAGVGVGHLAFDRLYALVGLSGGATIFNVFLVGQIAPCVVGALPYVMLRSRSGVPAVEPEAHGTQDTSATSR
jgi:uncharacterized protein (TIRG00374 family)